MGMFIHRHLTGQHGQSDSKPDGQADSKPVGKPRPVKRSTRKQGAK